MLFSNKRLPLAAAITAFVAATPVAAQQLEEVIVTAQKARGEPSGCTDLREHGER